MHRPKIRMLKQVTFRHDWITYYDVLREEILMDK